MTRDVLKQMFGSNIGSESDWLDLDHAIASKRGVSLIEEFDTGSLEVEGYGEEEIEFNGTDFEGDDIEELPF